MTEMEYYKYLRQYVGTKPLILPGSVVIILNNQGEVLLQKRPEGRWGLPGGLMNLGESFEQVAIREVFEETGIQVESLRLLAVFSGEDTYVKGPNGDEFYSITAVFITDQTKGEIQFETPETVDVRYFKSNELPEQMVGSHRRFIYQFLFE